MEPDGGVCTDLARVRDAVGNAHAAKAAAGQEQPRMSGQRAVDGGHTIQVTDVVLRVAALPALHPLQLGVAVLAYTRPLRR